MAGAIWILRSRITKLKAFYLTAIASLFFASFTLLASPAASADHESMYAVCPDPILEGNTANMRVRKPEHNVRWAYAFTYTDGYSADESDFEAYHGDKFTGTEDSNSLFIPAITKEDDRPEKNETFAIGIWHDQTWYGCEIRIIDDDVPEVANILITSMPTSSYYYLASDVIDVTVTFNQPVETDEDTLLSIYVGDEGESTWRGAKYHHGSGTQHLTFRYRVKPADSDFNGISVSSAGMDIERNPTHGFSGRINVKGTDVPVNYNHDGIPTASRHQIDGRPIALRTKIISSPPDPWNAYRANQTIEVAFTYNIDVEVDGEPTVGIGIGWTGHNKEEAWREAEYLRGSGTDTLVFGYTVTPGDNDDKGVAIFMGHPNKGYGGDGTIKAEGTDVEINPYYLGSGNQSAQKVDTTPPRIDSVAIVSNPSNGEAYGVGETISLRIDFSENITFVGQPRISVDVGGETRYATLQHQGATLTPGYADSALFQFQVQAGDNDDDGIGLFANSLEMNGGNIYDHAGIGLGFTHPAIAADPGQKVDTSNGTSPQQSDSEPTD